LQAHAALADVIVVNRQLSDYPLPDMRAVATDLLVSARIPILAVPDHLKRLDIGAAMVAWNGSISCSAALRAATPLLQLADRVTIVEVADGVIDAPAEDAAIYLSRYGVEARIKRLSDTGGTALAIAEYGIHGEFGYIVMGGFQRRPIFEAMFGGTSRAMLTASPIAVFMTH
jgi:nucleotide-binding universal stress UspA family protein